MFQSSDAIAQSLQEAGLGPGVSAQIAGQARAVVAFEVRRGPHTKDGLTLGASKLGGDPDLPEGFEWPHRPAWPDAARRVAQYETDIERLTQRPPSYVSPERRELLIAQSRARAQRLAVSAPLHFVGQIDLAEATAVVPEVDPDLPREGRLYFFFDRCEQPWGFLGADGVGARVLWDRSPRETLSRTAAPPSLAQAGESPVEALGLAPRRAWVPPSPDILVPLLQAQPGAFSEALPGALPGALIDAYWDWWWTHGGAAEHRLGGWPAPLQGDMRPTCQLASRGFDFGNPGDLTPAAKASLSALKERDWTLLWQIDSVEDSDLSGRAGLTWGDLGRLYLWIPRAALRARDFEASWVILQCG